MIVEDAGMLSESKVTPLASTRLTRSGFAGTAASSPVTTHFENNTPEPEPVDVQDVNLDATPIPVYPLPTKPFTVQLPAKISTGFAPVIPLERVLRHEKVRHWRIAQREIRGIAGGRWFARTWVGGKESEYASAAAAAAALKGIESNDKLSGFTLPKLSAVSISSPPVAGRRGRTGKTSSGTPSRSASVVPDISTVRAPTKMRTVVAAEQTQVE
jgi:hypothetical protein